MTKEHHFDGCPFCKGDVVSVVSAHPPDRGYQAQCSMCLARGPLSTTPESAAIGWNERV